MMSVEELADGMAQMTGSETWTRHGMWKSMLMTEGAMFVAENAQAHWLMDLVASHAMLNPKLKVEHFQVWKLKRCGNDPIAFDASVTDGDGGPVIVTQHIPFSDFPLDHITLWLIKSDMPSGWVLMLPDEY